MMVSEVSRPDFFEHAKPCPFCKCDSLFSFARGSVICDQCEAEGPFCGSHERTEEAIQRAVELWNARGESSYFRALDKE